jgi:hypothetical protein
MIWWPPAPTEECPSCEARVFAIEAKGWTWCPRCNRRLTDMIARSEKPKPELDIGPMALYWREHEGERYATRLLVSVGEKCKLERVKLGW